MEALVSLLMDINVNLNVSSTVCFRYSNLDLNLSWMFKGLFTSGECERESEKDQRTSEKDKRINGKHQRKFPLWRSFSLDLNTTFKYKNKNYGKLLCPLPKKSVYLY